MKRVYLYIIFVGCFCSFNNSGSGGKKEPFLLVLGIAQDAGYPQLGCKRDCCEKVNSGKIKPATVSCLALADPSTGQKWLFDATPDLTSQVYRLEQEQPGPVSGIFLTHAHIGHYTGLMYLGREAASASNIPVFAMPRMDQYLHNNGPWDQLIRLNNIEIRKMQSGIPVQLTSEISVTPFPVPHRDEYSETVGFSIKTRNRSVFYLPDIDKWQKWETDIRELVKTHDYLFLDGSFYKEGELPGRNMAEIPHPFVQESVELFSELSPSDKNKIWFIHFNHTNPLLDMGSPEFLELKKKGFHTAYEGLRLDL